MQSGWVRSWNMNPEKCDVGSLAANLQKTWIICWLVFNRFHLRQKKTQGIRKRQRIMVLFPHLRQLLQVALHPPHWPRAPHKSREASAGIRYTRITSSARSAWRRGRAEYRRPPRIRWEASVGSSGVRGVFGGAIRTMDWLFVVICIDLMS